MNSNLRIDWATAESARYACSKWHYSRSVPVFKVIRLGVWEDGSFVRVVMFGQGATPEIGKPYGLKRTEVCELTRIALKNHATPVSRIVSVALRFLKRKCPGIRLVVSFADESQGHHGGIYQAGNWIYVGGSHTHAYLVNGTLHHPKTLHSRYGKGGQSIPWLRQHADPNAQRVKAGFKHKYLMPLDDRMRQELGGIAKPYPKRVRSVDGDTSANQAEEGGSIPTRTLSNTNEQPTA